MAISYVQSASTSGSSVSPLTISVAYPGNVTKGNLLFVAFEDDTGEGAVVTGLITDTLGNTWTSFPVAATSLDTAGAGFDMNFFYCIANASGANTVSCHCTWSGGTFSSRASGLIVAEYSGVNTEGQASGSSSASSFGLDSITTTKAVELILSVVVEDSTVTDVNLTPGTGYTSRESINSGILPSARGIWMMLQDKITSVAGLNTPTYGGGPGKGGTNGTISFYEVGGGGVNWSPVDCRDFATFPNTGIVQSSGAVFYTGQTSSNPALPPKDSSPTLPPTDSRATIPQNSRTDPSL